MSDDALLDFRDLLIRELNNGYYDELSWVACARWAREDGRLDIAKQCQKYIDHYSQEME